MEEKIIKVATGKSEYSIAIFLLFFGIVWTFISFNFFIFSFSTPIILNIFLLVFIAPFLFIGISVLLFSFMIFLGYIKTYKYDNQALINYSLFSINLVSKYYYNIKDFIFEEKFPNISYPISTLLISDTYDTNLPFLDNISDFFSKRNKFNNYKLLYDSAVEIIVITFLKLLSNNVIKLTSFNNKTLLLGSDFSKISSLSNIFEYNDFMILEFDENYVPKDYIEESIINTLKTKDHKKETENPIFIKIDYVFQSIFPTTENNPKKWLCDKIRNISVTDNFFEIKEVETTFGFINKKDISYYLKTEYHNEFEIQREQIFNYLNIINKKYPELLDFLIKKANLTINKKTNSD